MHKDKMAEGLLRIEGVAYFVPTAMVLRDLLFIDGKGMGESLRIKILANRLTTKTLFLRTGVSPIFS